MNETLSASPLVLAAGEGELLQIRDVRLSVRAATPRVSVVEYEAPGGTSGPPLHVHPAFDEVFVVLEGTLTMRLGDDVREVGPGGAATAPGDVPHTFATTSDTPTRFLVICAPGGFERYFRALAAGDEAAAAVVAASAGYAAWPTSER